VGGRVPRRALAERLRAELREAWRASTDLTERERRRLAAIADHGGLETARVIHRFFRANTLMEALPLDLDG